MNETKIHCAHPDKMSNTNNISRKRQVNSKLKSNNPGVANTTESARQKIPLYSCRVTLSKDCRLYLRQMYKHVNTVVCHCKL